MLLEGVLFLAVVLAADILFRFRRNRGGVRLGEFLLEKKTVSEKHLEGTTKAFDIIAVVI